MRGVKGVTDCLCVTVPAPCAPVPPSGATCRANFGSCYGAPLDCYFGTIGRSGTGSMGKTLRMEPSARDGEVMLCCDVWGTGGHAATNDAASAASRARTHK